MPLNEDLITSFVSVLEKIVSSASESASKLTNASISSKINQYGDSFIKDGKVQVEQVSPLFSFESSLNPGDSILLLTQAESAAILADKMMGQESEELTFTEDKHEAYLNALLQSTKAALEASSEITSAGIQVEKPELKMVDPANEESLAMSLDEDRYLFEVSISFDGAEDKVFYLDLSSKNINTVLSVFAETTEAGVSKEDESADGETVGDIMGTDFAQIMDQHDPGDIDQARNLNLLMDIRLGLIVELGRAEMHLKDILKLTKGSIIELDRLSGEPVDLFVNNKLIARGEVVVIDDNFGLRINQLAGNTGKDKKLIGAKE